jgi:hypothetical protein
MGKNRANTTVAGQYREMFFNGVDARFGETNLPAVTA